MRLFLVIILVYALIGDRFIQSNCTDTSIDTEDDFSGDDIMQEILDAQDPEESESSYAEKDRLEVEKALHAAREAEKIEKEQEREELKKKMGQTSEKTSKNSLPGFSNRPGSSQSKGGSSEPGDSFRSRYDPAPELKEASKNVKGGSGMGKGGLEQQLGPEVLARLQQARAEKASVLREEQLQRRRDSTPRSQARPVEAILRLYRTAEDELPDLYRVLGLRGREGEAALKRAYRGLALLVHPDKNPHPDAQEAFDALQDAFATLAQPDLRSQYDLDLLRARKARRWSARKTVKTLRALWTNARSEWELVRRDLAQGPGKWMALRLREGGAALKASAARRWGAFGAWLRHLQRLSSPGDRLLLLHEALAPSLGPLLALAALHSLGP